MDGHFRAFSFVDRITRLDPGRAVRGTYLVPPHVAAFPSSLVAEAVGQLAAWAAMSAVGFSHRPVAGLAGGIELLAEVRPGQTLELAADLELVDTENAGYSGMASINGVPALRLEECVGPMLPADEFDDPECLRGRFARLRDGGAEPGAFSGLPPLGLEPEAGDAGKTTGAVLRLPAAAPFFADHFPRRPVFPGTLLMHAKMQVAAQLAAQVGATTAATWVPRKVSDVKLRTFLPPGETLRLEARLVRQSDATLEVAVESRVQQRRIGSAGITFAPEAGR